MTSLLVDSWNIGEVGGLWTGLTDAGQNGVYYWSDGSKLDYTNWLNTQPDERILEGSCVQATLQPGRMSWLFWQDVDCNSTLYFACAKPPSKYLSAFDEGQSIHNFLYISMGLSTRTRLYNFRNYHQDFAYLKFCFYIKFLIPIDLVWEYLPLFHANEFCES